MRGVVGAVRPSLLNADFGGRRALLYIVAQLFGAGKIRFGTPAFVACLLYRYDIPLAALQNLPQCGFSVAIAPNRRVFFLFRNITPVARERAAAVVCALQMQRAAGRGFNDGRQVDKCALRKAVADCKHGDFLCRGKGERNKQERGGGNAFHSAIESFGAVVVNFFVEARA